MINKIKAYHYITQNSLSQMSTFKTFGGLGRESHNNIVTTASSVNNEQRNKGVIGDTNTRAINYSHIDMSGNSILRVDSLYFLDGTVLRGGSHGFWLGSGAGAANESLRGHAGPAGPVGPAGPPGKDGKDGTNISNLSDINHNTFAGTNALAVNGENGKYNSAFGERALFKNTSGYANVAYGYETLVNATSGAYNTAIGTQAGAYNIVGTRNTFIGAAADATHPSVENSTAIGAGSRVTSSNSIQLGNTGIQTVITSGTFTAKAKNFTIDHPLPSLQNTHNLQQPRVEAPRLDIIYRDTIELYSENQGELQISIDKHFGMTPGTFVALCKNPSVFVSNESSWDQVRGYIKQDTLTIIAKNKITSSSHSFKVSFMVVAERKDPAILSSTITDSSGNLIKESKKKID